MILIAMFLHLVQYKWVITLQTLLHPITISKTITEAVHQCWALVLAVGLLIYFALQ